jgi:NADH-quinone oxidoreductase subunit E
VERTIPDVPGPILDDDGVRQAEAIKARYPSPRSAMVPLLYLIQSKVGWIPQQGLREVADLLGLRTAEVEAVATFYTMLKLRPTGKYVVSFCTNPPCSVRGGAALLAHARAALGDGAELVTDDGLFTVEEEECLGACDKAPVVTVNYLYYDRVTEADLDAMIDGIRRDAVPEASRGGVPGDWRAVSSTLAGAPAGVAAPPASAPPPSGPSDG